MEDKLIPYTPANVPPAKAVLVLAPHPDDEVFGCGGAILCHQQAGVQAHIVLVTSGGAGGDPEIRLAESNKAALILGCLAPECWGMPDRQIAYGETLVARILVALERTGADIVYAPSLWEYHPDHRAVALAALEAVRRHGSAGLMYYEVGAPLRPNLLVDITDVQAAKQRAMRCYPSQIERQAYDQQINALNLFRTYTLGAQVEAAEAFEFYSAAALADGALQILNSEYLRQQSRQLLLLPQDTPQVSILIRSIDRDTLQQTLDSVAAQTWPHIEVLVINAKGGRHRTLSDHCGSFALRLLNQDRLGLTRTHAANLGLDAAQGDYLLLLDDDDWITPEHIAKLASALKTSPEVNVAYTDVACSNQDGTPNGIVFQHDFDPSVLMASNYLPIHGVMFRRQLITDYGLRFDPAFDHYEDWDFWLQASIHGAFLRTPGVSAYYRIHESSGIHENQIFFGDTYTKIYQKWRHTWSDAKYGSLMQGVWQGKQQREVLISQIDDASARLAEALKTQKQQEKILAEQRLIQDSLRLALDEQKSIADEQEQRLAISAQQRSVLDAEIQARDVIIAAKQTLLESRVAELNDLLRHLDEHRALITKQNSEFIRLQQSLSWRITGPLRKLEQFFSEIRQKTTF